MLTAVYSKLVSIDETFQNEFQSSSEFVKIFTELSALGDQIFRTRREFYEKEVTRLTESIQIILKKIPIVDMKELSVFVKTAKQNDQKLLKLCDSVTDLFAGVEADLRAFGCKEQSLCENKSVPQLHCSFAECCSQTDDGIDFQICWWSMVLSK